MVVLWRIVLGVGDLVELGFVGFMVLAICGFHGISDLWDLWDLLNMDFSGLIICFGELVFMACCQRNCGVCFGLVIHELVVWGFVFGD